MELNLKSQKHLERLDAVMRAAEVKWGLPFRLGQLVDAELAGKFDRQWQALSSAVTECRHADICTLADGAIRGVWVLEAAAVAAGHAPLPLLPIGEPVKMLGGRELSPDIQPLPKAWFDAGGDDIGI